MWYKASVCVALWITVVLAAGCKTPEPSVSPLESPLEAVSPLTAAVPASTTTGSKVILTEPEDLPTPQALLDAGFDPAQAALSPEDMSDLFNASYGIIQPYERDGMRGIQVTYPTAAIDHTSAFAEGFSTQIEVYDRFVDAVRAFHTAVADQTGEPFQTVTQGDESYAFEAPSEIYGQGKPVYVVIIRHANALAILAVKPSGPLQAEALERAASIIVSRLTP
jgi:hypothetical protein